MKHYIKSFLWKNAIKFDIQRPKYSYKETLIVRKQNKDELIEFLNKNKALEKYEEKLDLIFIDLI